ncbi:class I SAM-dependent methyltransferase [Candidatus Pacearchaeota archaeon]|nr:class I SAM-dependent methyltransferase [Candidatus Pacearchaeota archaeon]
MESVTCNLCGSNNLKPVLKTKDYRFQIDNKLFQIVKCKNCDLKFLNPRPNEKEIKKYYPDDIKWEKEEPKVQNEKYSIIKNLKKGKILDIGCAKGEFLSFLKNKGYDVYGVEPSADSKIAEKKGIKVKNSISDFKKNFFDIITMWQVIEHLHNPNETLKKINHLLKKDGNLVISTLNMESSEAKFFKKHWFHLDIPRHLYFFSPKTLKKLLQKNGFKIIKIKHFSKQHSHAGIIFSLKNILINPKSRKTKIEENKGKNHLFTLCKLVVYPLSVFQATLKKGPIITIVAKKL